MRNAEKETPDLIVVVPFSALAAHATGVALGILNRSLSFATPNWFCLYPLVEEGERRAK